MKQTWLWALNLLLLGALAGCQRYQALPLNQQARTAALAPPDLARLTIQAKELKHPILQPLAMDFRDGLSPEEAAILAVLANPDLKAIRDERALAAAQLLDAGLLPDPVLALSKDVPVGGNDQGAITAHALQVSLDLTSLLTRGLRQRAAKASQQSVDLEVAWQEWQVAEMAKLSVYRLNALVPQVALAQEMILVLEENQHAIEKSAESGGTGLNELAAVRTALDAGSRNALFLKQALDRERQTLNALLGLQPHTDLILENPRAPRTWAALPSEAALVHGLDQRLDLVALEKGYESEDARLRLAVWSQFPSIGISLSRARDTSNVVTQGTGVALSLPLFNRGQGAVAVERATRQQLYDQYFARLQRARSDMAQIFSDLRIVRGMITAAERALPAIEAQAKNSEAAFREGQLDLLGRNQTRLTLLSQQTLLASLQSNLDELGIALEIASGHPLSSPEAAR